MELVPCTPSANAAELDRLGDEIAELSAHLDAATARLLDLIREFDARCGWGNGARSCAEWLSCDNLALLCRRHHRAVHEEGYRVERDADGTLRFSTPRGRPIPEVPAPPAVPADASRALVAAHRAQGLAIHARTACPDWGGERIDLGWAISVLHPAANPIAYRPAGRSP